LPQPDFRENLAVTRFAHNDDLTHRLRTTGVLFTTLRDHPFLFLGTVGPERVPHSGRSEQHRRAKLLEPPTHHVQGVAVDSAPVDAIQVPDRLRQRARFDEDRHDVLLLLEREVELPRNLR
jgi:hypothetical protein